MRIKFDYDEDAAARFAKILREHEERGENPRPALEAVASDFFDLEETIFRTEGRAVGAGWKPLSEKWRRWKAKSGLSTRILEMAPQGSVGRLRRSLTVLGAPWQVRRFTTQEVVVGTSLGIAKIHQTGGVVTITKGDGQRQARIPRRRFVTLRRVDKDRWLNIFADHLAGDEPTRRLGL